MSKIFRLSPMSSEQVLTLSEGEVVNDTTYNFRSGVPSRGGLLCQKIFGPVRDWCCECGQLRGPRYKDRLCPKCGVTVLKASSRRRRMGHINLSVPVVHPLLKSSLANLLDISPKNLDHVLRGSKFVNWENSKNGVFILDDGRQCKTQIFSNQKHEEKPGCSAVFLHEMLTQLNIDATIVQMTNREKIKQLREMSFLLQNEGIDSYFIRLLPVLPADFRPSYKMRFGYYAQDAKNDLYRQIIWQSRRTATIKDMFDFPLIIHNECALLQIAVEELMVEGSVIRGQKIASILNDLEQKTGLLRGNLLGKRVDYSGRTIIVAGPNLKMDEIGLPIQMAYEMYKPFILSYLEREIGSFVTARKRYLEHHRDAYDALEAVVKTRRVLLNRNPTLHKYGLFSANPILTQEKSISINPLVCPGLNADFDGDNCNVHLCLSDEANNEAETIMCPTNNLLGALNSRIIKSISHEYVIGIHMMTKFSDKDPKQVRDDNQSLLLYDLNELRINDPVYYFVNGERYNTCPGRIILGRLIKVSVNEEMTNKALHDILSVSYDVIGSKGLARGLDKLIQISQKVFTMSGLSLGMDDFKEPSTRSAKFTEAINFQIKLQKDFENGNITDAERREEKIRNWHNTIEDVYNDWIEDTDENKPLRIMLKTGSRVSKSQVKQLIVAVGLQSTSSGDIVEDPVIETKGNTGQSPGGFFAAVSGARKAMNDKFSSTPKSGHLARKLVNASRDFYITEKECNYKSSYGIGFLASRGIGRTLLDGTKITKDSHNPTDYVVVRSPVYCTARNGVCAICYGIDPSTRQLPVVGTPVGIVAAQSLTEPTTQLTMRSKHTAGAAEVKDSVLIVKSATTGRVEIENRDGFRFYYINDLCYLCDEESSKSLVENGQEVEEEQVLAVYTDENLLNADIANKLNVLESYYEIRLRGDTAAIVAPRDGTVSLTLQEGRVSIFLDDEPLGSVSGIPIFVANGQHVRGGTRLTFGEIDLKKYKDFGLQVQLFCNRIYELYAEEGITPWSCHIEMICRSLSEIVKGKMGQYEYWRYNRSSPRALMGATDIGINNPSFLKALTFGYTKRVITRIAGTNGKSYDLPSERLMQGLYPLIDIKEENS